MRKCFFYATAGLAFWAATYSHVIAQQSQAKSSQGISQQSQNSDGSDDDQSSSSKKQKEQANKNKQSKERKKETGSERNQSQSSRPGSDSQTGDNRNQQRSAKQSQERDAEVRLRYDDERNRLDIEVDDQIKFQDNRDPRRAWVREGQMDLRYDRDRNVLRSDVEGAFQLNRIGTDMASWWQSWWEQERQTRRSRQESAERGTQEFVRQHDRNTDGYVSRQELPQRLRSEFAEVDRDDDGYLSGNEIRRFGDARFDLSRASRNSPHYSSNQGDDQTWSEWWASWFGYDSDERGESDENSEDRSISGARQFVRQHDDNGDDFISRGELPARMRDELSWIDRNSDGYLSLTEIRQHGYTLFRDRDRGSRSSGSLTNRGRNSSNDQTWSEWWSSWWSDESESGTASDIAASGAKEFIRRHDRNGDGYLLRSELPQGMYDEFSRIDQNDDRYLSRGEIQRYAQQTRNTSSRDYSQTAYRASASSGASGQPTETIEMIYLKILEDDGSGNSSSDLQETYRVLSQVDANDDGQLSSSELRQHREQVASDFANRLFQKHDLDDDGRLTRSELRSSVVAGRFDRFDQDDSDALTRDEIRRSVQQRLGQQSRSGQADAEGRR